MQTKFHTVCTQITVWNPNPKRICTMVQHKPLHEPGTWLDFFKSQTRSEVGRGKAFMAPKRSLSTGGGGEASASRGKRAPRVGEGAASRGVDGAVSRSAQSLQQAASHLAGGKGARGGAGNGSEDGGSSGSDGGAVGRVASERHRTPEQPVCLSLDSVCNGAPGLIAL